MINPPPNSVQEIKLITGDYDPEFGSTAGMVAQFVTKSGTNQLHGSVYEYNQNAATFATTPSPGARRSSRTTGTRRLSLGGPVKKDRYLPLEIINLHGLDRQNFRRHYRSNPGLSSRRLQCFCRNESYLRPFYRKPRRHRAHRLSRNVIPATGSVRSPRTSGICCRCQISIKALTKIFSATNRSSQYQPIRPAGRLEHLRQG